MVLATHIIFTAYGFWLPNDPRGSWSDFVAAWELFLKGGKATKVDTRRSLAHDDHDAAKRRQTKGALKQPPVRFNGLQAISIAHGFAKAISESAYRVLACSIMPDHVHLVVERHAHEARAIVRHLKGRASQELSADLLHPFAHLVGADGTVPTPWVRNCWRVFLDTPGGVSRAVHYVEQNPVREGFKLQQWSFVRGPAN
jgi:REP element-mobilizing transposase RayT